MFSVKTSMKKKNYTDAEKAEYYKAKYQASRRGAKRGSPAYAQAKQSKAYYKYKTAKQTESERIRRERASEARTRGPGAISAVGGALGGVAGEFLGGPAGLALGTLFGEKAGHIIEQITGFGAYRINHNSLMRGGMSPAQVVNSHNKGGYIVRHREYICDIQSSSAFTIQTFNLNPGMSSSFPWLSQIASSFEEYRWRGLIFEFKSMSSNAVLSTDASTSLGTVILASQYNSVAPPFADKRTMENHEFACSANPSETFIHPVECKSTVTPVSILYVRSGAVPANADQRLYDLGEFSVATQGMQNSGGVIGELWATYEIEFFKSAYSPQNQTDHFRITNATNAAPLGDTPVPQSGSSIGGRIVLNGTGYSFPVNISTGKYICVIAYTGSPGAAITLPALGYTNCVPLLYWRSSPVSVVGAPQNSVNSTAFMMSFTFQVTGQNASFGLSGAGLPLTVQTGDMWIAQISNSVNS